MKCPLLLGLASMLCFTTASAADVWKCKLGDRVVFSDVPCPADGAPVQARRLQGNVIDGNPVPPPPTPLDRPAPATPGRDTPSPAPESAARQGNVCPADHEIRDMETQASSISLSQRQKAFLDDEIRRARQCRNGQGSYTTRDWQISREARDAQGNISGAGDARRRAEGMHSAADPVEGDRIAAQRRQEESDRRRIEALRERPQRAGASPRITGCDAGGCWAGADYYRRGGDGSFAGPAGACRRTGEVLDCR